MFLISHVSQTRVEQRWLLRARADKNKSTLLLVAVPKVLRGVGEGTSLCWEKSRRCNRRPQPEDKEVDGEHAGPREGHVLI